MGRVICRGCGCGWFGACVLCAVWRWVVSCFPHGVGGSYVQQTVDDLENAETEAMMAADEEEGLLCVWNRCSRCCQIGLTRLNAWSCCCVTCYSVVLGSSFATASEDAVSELIEQRKEVRVMQQWPAPTAAGLAGSSQVACCV